MSNLKQDLSNQMKAAMKSGDKTKLGFCRNLLAAIKKQEIDTRQDLTDEDVLKVIAFSVKQRRDSIDQFKTAGRDDLVANEQSELDFLITFMPPQLSDEELSSCVEDAIKESQASTPKDMGKVMKVLLPKVQGRADGKKVSQLVKQLLGQG